MNTRKAALLVLVVVLGAAPLMASGPLGIYGIVEKVVFEPNEQAPERVQVWGAFAYVDGQPGPAGMTISRAVRGYLYFRLPSAAIQAVKNEWLDLKSVAGTGQAVGFGRWGYIAGFSSLQPDMRPAAPSFLYANVPGGGAATDLRVRPSTEAPADPAVYQTDSGVVKIGDASHPAIVKALKDALAR